MNDSDKSLILVIRIAVDLTMTCIAWFAAYYIRFYTVLGVPLGIPIATLYFKLIPFILVIWCGVFALTGCYRRTGHHRSAFIEGLEIIQSNLFAVVTLVAFTYFYEEYRYSRITTAVFGLLNPFCIITGRSLVRKTMRYCARKAPARKILLLGAGDILRRAVDLCRRQNTPLAHRKIQGVILLPMEPTYQDDLAFCHLEGLSVLEAPLDWTSFLVEHPVQTVYLAIPQRAYAYFEEKIAKIADQVPDIKLIPDILKYTRFSAAIEIADGVPVIAIHQSPLCGMGSLIKRSMDIIGSALGILLLSPVMLLVAIFIPLSSRGPILYRQERMGLDGKKFACLKFRSMPVDAEQKTGAVWASKSDGRATWLGHILRRTSLDELPQLFNVFKGDMSLVGPRPERPVFVNRFRSEVPGYMLRHKVKSGITGWAQVSGWRGDTSIEKRIEYDLFYIQNWSLWFDIKILLLTIEEVLFSKNAY